MIAKSLHKVNEMLSISEILSLVQITKKAEKSCAATKRKI